MRVTQSLRVTLRVTSGKFCVADPSTGGPVPPVSDALRSFS